MTCNEWLSLKANVADAFADVYAAESGACLTDGQVANLLVCVNALNDFLNKERINTKG